MDLVILAAGMGSRFGGLKQLEPMDTKGNFIIDYSIYDAIKAGFNKIIFIIRKENEAIFKNSIGERIKSKITVEYVFQENNTILDDHIPTNRIKPLGTGHAILCCKDVIKEPFMIINADDFYGYSSYKIATEFIKNYCNETTFGCVTYEAGKTITENGSVKRGICNVVGTDIRDITESSISKNNHGTLDARPLNEDTTFEINVNTPVSMNMFILNPSIFSELEQNFKKFIKKWSDPEKDEYLLPDMISNMVKNGKVKLKNVKSPEKWYGITYKEDKKSVIKALDQMRKAGQYPESLWN